MSIKVWALEVGALMANCYIVKDEATGRGMVLDPGGDADDIVKTVDAADMKVDYVVCTHGHSDHIGALDDIRDYYKAPVLIHPADAAMLVDARENLSAYIIQGGFTMRPADGNLSEDQPLILGSVPLEILHTPGHSPGSVCLYSKSDGYLFAGDTLFAGSVGRTDFPNGSMTQLLSNIRNKLFVLPDSTKVLPGHGGVTTIGIEKATNPFALMM